MLAQATDTPELQIAPEEGAQYMAACQNVMRHYSVTTTQKTLDWLALVGCTAALYAPRMAAIRFRKMEQRARRGASGNVVKFPDGEQAAPIEPIIIPSDE